MIESKSRTLIKIILWRCVGVVSTVVFAYIFTGSFSKSWKIALADNLFKLVTHYGFERLFGKIKWGLIDNDKIN